MDSASDDFLHARKLQALANGIATIPGGLVNENYSMAPIIISNCNAAESWTFSAASVDYKEGFCFPVSFWLPKAAECILSLLVKKGVPPNSKQMGAIDCLLNFVYDEKHRKCLEWLNNYDQKSEATIQAVVALHLFAPLAGQYMVNSIFPGRLKQCPSCHENVISGDTSLGNTSVWHGNADIAIHRSVVKIEKEWKSTVEAEMDIQSDIDTNSSIQQREENGMDELEDTKQLDDTDASSNTTWSLQSFQHQKMAFSQAIALTIVNSFCELKTNAISCFIPSFIVNERQIRMIFYNCESDILLYSEPLFIWKQPGSLDFSSLIHLWAALNFDVFEENIPFSNSLPTSNFQNIIGEKLKIYLEAVSRPSIKIEKQSNSMQLRRYALDKEFTSTIENCTVLNEYSLLVSDMIKSE